jgi:hypothetical protein
LEAFGRALEEALRSDKELMSLTSSNFETAVRSNLAVKSGRGRKDYLKAKTRTPASRAEAQY